MKKRSTNLKRSRRFNKFILGIGIGIYVLKDFLNKSKKYGSYEKICKKDEQKIKDNLRKKEIENILKDNNFFISENADCNNLIIDTCALSRQETINLIHYAKKVKLIEAILNEFDKKKKDNDFFAKNVREYAEQVLNDKSVQKIPFTGFSKDTTADDALIEYCSMFPEDERPTLLTADKYLAIKAESRKLKYIFFKMPTTKTEKVSKQEIKAIVKEKKNIKRGDTYIIRQEDKIVLKNYYPKEFKIFYSIKGQNILVEWEEKNLQREINLEEFEYSINAYWEKEEKTLKISKVLSKNNLLEESLYTIRSEEDLYRWTDEVQKEYKLTLYEKLKVFFLENPAQ